MAKFTVDRNFNFELAGIAWIGGPGTTYSAPDDLIPSLREHFDRLGHGTVSVLSLDRASDGKYVKLVAASNAPQTWKDAADYQCDGIADNVEIQSGHDAINTAGGGILLLSPGTFNIAAHISISLGKGFTMRGSGWATILHAINGLSDDVIQFSPPSSGIWAEFADFKIECNGAQQTAGNGIYAKGALQSSFHHLWINQPYMNGLYLYQDGNGGTGHHNRITNCLFDQGNVSPSGDGRGLRIEASDENTVSFCDFESNGRAAAGEPNQLFDMSGLNNFLGDVFVGGETGIKIQGNNSHIIGCTFDGTVRHSIRINGTKNVISGNNIFNPGIGSGSPIYDGIIVDNVGGNLVTGNTFLSDNTGSRSGINFANGATGNLAEGNTFTAQGNGWGTGAIIPGSGNIVRQHIGWVTEASGTATVASGQTTIAVTHGLSSTPALKDIQVSPTNSLGTATKFWISNPTSTQFTINVDQNPGATTATFVWAAAIY